ncbi:hypothetical protein MXB_4869 [Myxobolus squamalis]|nr:hypothetical protein MXB_4869 [Myxobolus squamalis]
MAIPSSDTPDISNDIPENIQLRSFVHNTLSLPKTSTAKTLVIPGFSDTRTSSTDKSLELWNILELAVDKILAGKSPDSGYAELYDNVDELCRQAEQRKMISCLKKMLQTHFGSKIHEISVKSSPNSYHDLLLLYQSFQAKASNICKIFTVLDRNYLFHDNSAASLMSMALDIFSKQLSQNEQLLNFTISSLLILIEKMRIGEPTDTQGISSLVRMLVDLHFYTSLFETPFLEKSRTFYASESQRNINKPISDFLKNVAFRIKFEENDVCSLISPSTHVKLVQIVKWECFGEHFPINLKKGFFKLLDDLQVTDIQLVYALALQVKDGTEVLRANIVSYVKTRVTDFLSQSPSQPDFEINIIESIMLLKENLSAVILPCFNNDPAISKLICVQHLKLT